LNRRSLPGLDHFDYFHRDDLAISAVIVPTLNGDTTQWWKLATIISCGTLAGAVIPELVKVFTSTESRHVREVVASAEEGGASLGICPASWRAISPPTTSASPWGADVHQLPGQLAGFERLDDRRSSLAFGLVAFGFLGMGPVTIAVDSYGPVTDNAQSVLRIVAD